MSEIDVYAMVLQVMSRYDAALYIHGGGEERCEEELKELCDLISAALKTASPASVDPVASFFH